MSHSNSAWPGVVAWLAFAPVTVLSPQLAFADPGTPAPSAAEVTSAPAMAPSVSSERPPVAPELAPIAEKIRGLLDGPVERIIDDVKNRDALRAFYEARNYAPVWFSADGPTPQMRAAVARLKAADADGLDPSDYPTPDVAGVGADPEKLGRAELSLMGSLLTYARHAQSGRVDPSRISPNIAFTPPVPEPRQVLDTLAGATDVAATLEDFNPPHRGFQRLRAKLKEQRRQGAGEKHGERGRGKPAASHVDTILSNMERWRWLPRDLGATHVLVNIPDYRLDVMRGERSLFQTRIVAGKKDTPSPSFSDEIETVQVNPTWHVPESIVYGKYLPALSRDPDVLRRMGLVVSRGRDGKVSVRQPPGPRNALGHLKVNFPNPFHVYLHDTPDKHLFTRDQRAYSAGCMRVENPDQFAAHVLAIGDADGNYTPARLKSMYGKAERWIPLKTRIPIHLVYMNTYVADDGRLVVKPDMYGYDARVQSALKGRYMVVKERSQRGSSVVRTAAASRSASQQWRRARVVDAPARDGWYGRRSVFGGLWSWNPEY